MKYQAVLFDLDGTLLDTIQDLADSMNEVLRRHGFPTHAVEAYKYFVGDGVKDLVRRALPRQQGNDETVTEFVARMREEYGKRWADQSLPYPGIPELLDGLTKRSIRMAVLSNKPDDFTKKMVTHMLPRWSFEQVVGQRPNVPRKPDPTAALKIAAQLNLEPELFLYLGDTNTDMKTAVAAGMFPVGACWGFRPASELLDHGAKVLLEKPADLLDLL